MVYTIVVHLLAKEDQESINKLSAKLVEASQVYSKDKETLSWFVMQDTADKRKFTIVERYLKESVSLTMSLFCFLRGLWKSLVVMIADADVGSEEEISRDALIPRATKRQSCYWGHGSRYWNVLTLLTVSAIPPEQPLLEDLRPLRHPVAGCTHGSEASRGAGYDSHKRGCALPRGCCKGGN